MRRVEVPAYSDAWMRGDRFGEVIRYIRQTRMTVVRLGKSGKSQRFLDADLRYLD